MEAHHILHNIERKLEDLIKLEAIKPHIEFYIRPLDVEPYCVVIRHEPTPGAHQRYEFFRADSPEGCLIAAGEWILQQPSPRNRALNMYLQLVAKAVDFGKEKGLDTALVNPLEAIMKKLSENALTHQRAHISQDRQSDPPNAQE